MQRSSKVLLSTIIILATLVLISVLLASLELLYNQSLHTTADNVNTNNPRPTTVSELVILHDQPVTVDRFGLTVTVSAHEKINDQAVATTIHVTAPDQSIATSIHFEAIGQTVETNGYRFSLVNATADTMQFLIMPYVSS